MFNRFIDWVRESVTLKLIAIAFLILFMLIPASMVQDLVRERKYRMQEVQAEIQQKWGASQTITGPMIAVPYKNYFYENGKTIYNTAYAYFLPESLVVSGSIRPEIRYRGIYKVISYHTDLKITGSLPQVDMNSLNIDSGHVDWSEAKILMGITDMKGISKKVNIDLDGESLEFNPGLPDQRIIASGLSADADRLMNDESNFSIDLSLRGSESLNFIPVGKSTEVEIQSDWKSPSFTGGFLPEEREISDQGFNATWRIFHLNREYPQAWKNSTYHLMSSAFGTRLMFPVDHYQKSTRSVKYAVMFIALTFIIFFLCEILMKIRIHPIQYLLVGIGLVVFYTLLISISEHANFEFAYGISTFAIVGLITFYSRSVLRSYKLASMVGAALTSLYIYLFFTLQMEDYSLLIGSLGLFVILSLVMYLSRNIDWYGVTKSTKNEGESE